MLLSVIYHAKPEIHLSSWHKLFDLKYLQTCQLSRFSRESPSFSSNLPVSWLEHQISWELPTVALFNFFFSLILLFSRHRERSEGLRVIFGEYSDIVENCILTMQRFLAVSRFLYSGGWRICIYHFVYISSTPGSPDVCPADVINLNWA